MARAVSEGSEGAPAKTSFEMKNPSPKKMEFEIDGEKRGLVERITPTAQKALDFLKTMPDGKMFSTRVLCEKVGISYGTFMGVMVCPALSQYRVIMARTAYWGNERTIAAARAELIK
jgi:hypothetical protein